MEEYKDQIGNIATISAVGLFLTGSTICWNVYKVGNTKDFSPSPFLAGLLNGGIWTRYGFLIEDSAVITVNSIAIFLYLPFLAFYYKYTWPKGPLNKRIILLAALFTALFFYTNVVMVDYPSIARESVGMMASASTVVFCAAPLALIAGVLRTRSTEFLPLPVIIMTFVVTGLWWLYGHIIHDIYLQIPNMLGCILASAQLSLFLIFPRKRVNDDGVQLLHVQ